MAKEFESCLCRKRIAELESTIAGYEQSNRHYSNILADRGKWALGQAKQFRENAAAMVARAERFEQDVTSAPQKLAEGQQRIEELRAQIATIRSEEEIAKLEAMMEQYDTILSR